MNETAIALMGLEDPVGKTVMRSGREHVIIGVMKDFHLESLYEEIMPCYLRLGDYGNRMVVKIQRGQEQAALAGIEAFYHQYNPGLPFEYRFLDEDFQALYESEHRVAQLSRYFAGMAILISCLGLFGLAAFTAQRRLKEIGIRKVLGASPWSIVQLLSQDFSRMIALAICLALPISFLLARSWLNDFVYRIDLQIWFFFLPALLVILISWLTVSLHTVQAVAVNPAETLRGE